MELAVCPTIGFYQSYCIPIKELGFTHFSEARMLDLITEKEYRFCLAMVGDHIPTFVEFNQIQVHAMNKMREIAGI